MITTRTRRSDAPLPLAPPSPAATHIAQVYQAYASLLRLAPSQNIPPSEGPLGGKLLYVAELDSTASTLLRAANIAGAASIAASANASALQQAQRDGVIDFLVNTLDEALRILKNEIRKHQPVAVAVSLAHELITNEMLERGVLPDLLPNGSSQNLAALAAFLTQGAKPLPAPAPDPLRQLQIWPIPTAYNNRPAEFEAILATYIQPEDLAAGRWLHLSSRYLDPTARRFRSLPTGEETAEKLARKFGPPLNA